jgi:predicted PurR-regulated permease PerM
MATTREQDNNLSPRVSILEKGQEAIQRDIITLSHSIREQGSQLTNTLTKISESNQNTFNTLSEKISSINKTDWQSFWTMIGTLVVIIAAIMAPVWMSFTYVNSNAEQMNEAIKEIKATQIENIKYIASLQTELRLAKDREVKKNE